MKSEQLTLDFEAPATHHAPPAASWPPTATRAVVPHAPVVAPAATPTPSQTPRESAPPHGSLLPRSLFEHPAANRRIVLSGHAVAYRFRRARRRTLGASVSADGLTVSAPRWAAIGDIETFLRERSDWILRKLRAAEERERQVARSRIEWRDGAVLPYLGQPVVLQLDPSHQHRGGGQLVSLDTAHVSGAAQALVLPLPSQASDTQVRDAVQAWLMRQAKALFTERLHHFAPLLDVQWHKLRLSSAATRWGSATSDGSIRLNWRLIHLGLPQIDYVVAHELAHLREMNHSPRFWETVAGVMPDYATRRHSLRAAAVPAWS